MDRPYVARELIPLGTPVSANLLNAIDRPLQEGTFDPDAIAPLARLIGAGDIVLRSDLQYERFRTPRPETTGPCSAPFPGSASRWPSASRSRTSPGPELPLLDEIELATDQGLDDPPPVAVFPVDDAAPIVRALPVEHPIVVSGDGDGLVAATAAGVIDPDRAILYSAGLLDERRPDACSTPLCDDGRRPRRHRLQPPAGPALGGRSGRTRATPRWPARRPSSTTSATPASTSSRPPSDDSFTVAVQRGGATRPGQRLRQPRQLHPGRPGLLRHGRRPAARPGRSGAFERGRGRVPARHHRRAGHHRPRRPAPSPSPPTSTAGSPRSSCASTAVTPCGSTSPRPPGPRPARSSSSPSAPSAASTSRSWRHDRLPPQAGRRQRRRLRRGRPRGPAPRGAHPPARRRRRGRRRRPDRPPPDLRAAAPAHQPGRAGPGRRGAGHAPPARRPGRPRVRAGRRGPHLRPGPRPAGRPHSWACPAPREGGLTARSSAHLAGSLGRPGLLRRRRRPVHRLDHPLQRPDGPVRRGARSPRPGPSTTWTSRSWPTGAIRCPPASRLTAGDEVRELTVPRLDAGDEPGAVHRGPPRLRAGRGRHLPAHGARGPTGHHHRLVQRRTGRAAGGHRRARPARRGAGGTSRRDRRPLPRRPARRRRRARPDPPAGDDGRRRGPPAPGRPGL